MDRELAVGSGAGSIAGRDRARRTYSREGRGAYRIGAMPSTREFLALWFGPATTVEFGPLGRHWLGFMDGATEA